MDPRTDPALEQLAALAKTAELHAASNAGGPADMDAALDACRRRNDPAEISRIVPCYGAWLGERLRRDLGARWVGLHEPSAPRLVVAGQIISPMDAVARRLRTESAASLRDILRQAREGISSTPSRDRVLETNRAVWNRLTSSNRFTGLAPDLLRRESALEALDPWIAKEGLEGRRVLCLGAGGGRQGPLHAAAGAAEVVVVDLSEDQLDLDRQLAREHGLKIRTVQASIDDLAPLEDGTFDIAVQPVASSYVPDLEPVHHEVARVVRGGGLYVVQHKQPASLRTGPYVEGNVLSAETGGHREEGCIEFLHTLESLIGGLCRAGFVVEDLVEPPLADALASPDSFEHRAVFLPPYLKIKARRRT